MAVGAIARVLLGLAVKGLKKTSKKVVKKPKSAKATKTSAADDAKTQGRDYKRMKKAESKDARTAKRMDKEGTEAHNKRVRATRTRVIDRKKFRTRKNENATRVEYKVTRAGKRPVTTAKKVAVAGLAAAAGNVRGPAGKSVKVKGGTKPVVWRNTKRVGRTKVASKLRTEYNPKTDQWIKYTD